MQIEPTILWGGAVAVGGFLAYLIKDYIATLKMDRDAWREMAMRGLTVAEKAVPVAEKVTRRRPTLSASAAKRAREAVRRSADAARDT